MEFLSETYEYFKMPLEFDTLYCQFQEYHANTVFGFDGLNKTEIQNGFLKSNYSQSQVGMTDVTSSLVDATNLLTRRRIMIRRLSAFLIWRFLSLLLSPPRFRSKKHKQRAYGLGFAENAFSPMLVWRFVSCRARMYVWNLWVVNKLTPLFSLFDTLLSNAR